MRKNKKRVGVFAGLISVIERRTCAVCHRRRLAAKLFGSWRCLADCLGL